MQRDPFFGQCFTVVDQAAHHCTRGCCCDADDLRQDVLERVLRKADLFRSCDPARLVGYLWTTTRRVHYDRHRRGAGRYTWVPTDNELGPVPLAGLTSPPDQELYVGLSRAVAQLVPDEIDALALDVASPWTGNEAAAQLGLSRGAYHQRSSRARRRLLKLAGLTRSA